MNALRYSILGPFLLAASVALAGCSSGGGGSTSPPGPVPVIDNSPVTPKNAAGLWKLHYEWDSAPPEAWTTFFGSAKSGDVDVAIPSEEQPRGMFSAETDWGFAPMIAKASSGTVKWTFSLNGADGPFTIDFEGKGTGASLEGGASISNGDASATWTAKKAAAVPQKGLAGDWTLDFQWARRTPGQLLVKCDEQRTCKIPGGQDGGPAKDEIGAVVITGNQIVIEFPGSKYRGVITSDTVVWGYMDSADQNTGVWSATRGNHVDVESNADPECTADVDCGSCERCERSTGRCIARLTC